jgi:hypothetical protein
MLVFLVAARVLPGEGAAEKECQAEGAAVANYNCDFSRCEGRCTGGCEC